MIKRHKEYIEELEEEMMDAWNRRYEDVSFGVGNSMRILGRCAYDVDKKKILRKKRWDKECDKFIKKMKAEIRKS